MSFTVEAAHCEDCAGRLHASNSVRRRPVQTLKGKWRLEFRDKVCRNHICRRRGQLIRPRAEGELPILARKGFGLDVIAWIGEQRAAGKLSQPEIHSNLKERFGLNISARHVANLFQTFMALVHCIDASTSASLQEKLREQGKIILSIDGVYFESSATKSSALNVRRSPRVSERTST